MSQSSKSTRAPAHVPEGASFLVRLDPLECAKKVLIPGHRFEPFHSHEISIPKLKICLPDASLLPKRNIVLPYREVFRFHSLLSFLDLFSMLEEMYPGNIPINLAHDSQALDRLIRLSVFDLEPLFPGTIQHGSYVHLTVQHYRKGIFSATPVTPEEASRLDREAWFSAMDAAFARAFDELKFPRPNDTILSLVYRYGGKALYENPGAALIDYLDAKRVAEIIHYAGENLIWKKGADPEHIILSELDALGTGRRKPRKAASATTPRARKTSPKTRLKRFLEDYEFAFNADEIKALMLDMAYRGTTLQDLWDRFFEFSPQWTVYPEAADKLADLLEDYCDDALARYDPERDGFGEMRAALVDLYADYIEWMRRLDARLRSPEDLPMEKLTELVNLISSLNEFMVLMNSPAEGSPDDPAAREGLEQFFDSVDSMRQTIADLEHEIETIALRRRKRR